MSLLFYIYSQPASLQLFLVIGWVQYWEHVFDMKKNMYLICLRLPRQQLSTSQHQNSVTLCKKWSFLLRISSVNVTKFAVPANLVTFTEESLTFMCILIRILAIITFSFNKIWKIGTIITSPQSDHENLEIVKISYPIFTIVK